MVDFKLITSAERARLNGCYIIVVAVRVQVYITFSAPI